MVGFQNGAIHVLACLGPNIERLSGLNIFVCACATNQNIHNIFVTVSAYFGDFHKILFQLPNHPILGFISKKLIVLVGLIRHFAQH